MDRKNRQKIRYVLWAVAALAMLILLFASSMCYVGNIREEQMQELTVIHPELRQELQEMLATVPTLRRPALRRSEDANALFATDLPLLADAADFCRLAEKHGWRTWMQGGWLLLDKLPNPPDMPTKIPGAPGELGCCLSLLARHPDDTADGTLLRALLKSADAGGQAMEKYCRMLHRDLAARLRTHNPLPGRLLPYLCRAAEERTGNP